MATEKTARATWEGTLAEGRGRFSLGSGAVTDQRVTWKDRAEEGGGTSPEELIAAAHASCVLMALAGGLAKAGTPPTRLESEARTMFDKVGEGFKFTKIELASAARSKGSTTRASSRPPRARRKTAPSRRRSRATSRSPSTRRFSNPIPSRSAPPRTRRSRLPGSDSPPQPGRRRTRCGGARSRRPRSPRPRARRRRAACPRCPD